jgi:type I restriction enzyme S subunit
MTSNINQLTIGTLHKLTVVAPKDRILQTAIVNYLDQQTTLIDRKIELLNAKKQSYLELKQILIKEVVTGGLDKTTEMKDSEIEWIGQIPKHWELRRGKDLFKYIKKINKQLECKNVLSLTYNGVINKDYNTKAGLNPESYETYQFVDKNDLIFKLIDLENIKTSRVGIVHEHGIMSSAYIRLKSNKSFNKYFYYLYFYYYKINLFNYLGGGVRSTINFSTLLEISIIIPKKSEQIAIANYLDEKTNKIDQIIKKIDENVLALQEFRKTLINDVVTGKVKVL